MENHVFGMPQVKMRLDLLTLINLLSGYGKLYSNVQTYAQHIFVWFLQFRPLHLRIK